MYTLNIYVKYIRYTCTLHVYVEFFLEKLKICYSLKFGAGTFYPIYVPFIPYICILSYIYTFNSLSRFPLPLSIPFHYHYGPRNALRIQACRSKAFAHLFDEPIKRIRQYIYETRTLDLLYVYVKRIYSAHTLNVSISLIYCPYLLPLYIKRAYFSRLFSFPPNV